MSNNDLLDNFEIDLWPEEEDKYIYAENISKSKVFPNEAEALAWRAAEIAAYKEKDFTVIGEDDKFSFILPFVEEMSKGRWIAYVDVELMEYPKDAKTV